MCHRQLSGPPFSCPQRQPPVPQHGPQEEGRRKGGGSPDNRICSVQGGQGDMCVRRPRHVVCSRRRERVDQEGKDGEGRWEGAPEGVGEERKGSGGSGRKPESRERVAARGRQTGFLIPVKKSGRVFSPPKQAGDRRAGPTWMPTAIPADALKLEIAAKAPSFVSFASALLVSLAGAGCGDFAARRGVRGQGRTYGPSGKFAIPTAVR